MIKLFNPKELLELDIDAYIVHVSNILKKIACFFTLIIVVAIIAFCFMLFELNYADCMFSKIFSLCKMIFNVGILFTLAVLITQSCLTRKHKQVSIDLEKSHKAVDLLYKWSYESNAEMLLARKIVDRMKDEEVKKLADGNEPVMIAKKDYDMIEEFFPANIARKSRSAKNNDGSKKTAYVEENKYKNKKVKKSKCSYADKCEKANSKELTMAQTIWLRSWIVKYLNSLEVIMYAWQAGVIDRSIIEKEFEYLVQTEHDGSVVLEKYIKFSGRGNYPGIYSFCNHIEEINKKKIEKTNIGG